MIREIMLWISEMLFYLQGGDVLVSTFWIFPWIGFWVLVMVFPLFYYVNYASSKYKYLSLIIFMFVFFPALLMAIGLPPVQHQMITECRDDIAEVNIYYGDNTVSEKTQITITQCRYKENYYGEFGEWKLKVNN